MGDESVLMIDFKVGLPHIDSISLIATICVLFEGLSREVGDLLLCGMVGMTGSGPIAYGLGLHDVTRIAGNRRACAVVTGAVRRVSHPTTHHLRSL